MQNREMSSIIGCVTSQAKLITAKSRFVISFYIFILAIIQFYKVATLKMLQIIVRLVEFIFHILYNKVDLCS